MHEIASVDGAVTKYEVAEAARLLEDRAGVVDPAQGEETWT
jgi:hypothetical protein